MKSILNALCAFALFASTSVAVAMPCDVATHALRCKSKSGIYRMFVRYCGLNERIQSHSLTVNGNAIADQVVDWNGTLFKGFRFDDSKNDEVMRSVTVELNATTLNGIIMDTIRSDESDASEIPHDLVKQESINCVTEK